MQHQWTAVKKEMAALGEDGGFGAVADEGAEEGEATMKATPKKRAAPKGEFPHIHGESDLDSSSWWHAQEGKEDRSRR